MVTMEKYVFWEMSFKAYWVMSGVVLSPSDLGSAKPLLIDAWLLYSSPYSRLYKTQCRCCLMCYGWSCSWPCGHGGLWCWDPLLLIGAAKSHIFGDPEAGSDDWGVWAEAQAGWYGERTERTRGKTEKSRGECDASHQGGVGVGPVLY